MGFKAEWVAEPLDYDFRPYVDVEGTIPEPSTKLVDQFRRRWDALMRAAEQAVENRKDATPDGPEFAEGKPLKDLLDVWATYDGDSDPAVEQLNVAIVKLIAFVCQNKPTVAQISKLPNRQRRAFIAFVRAEMLDPKLHSGATPLPVVTPAG